jgi:hypothetical protein
VGWDLGVEWSRTAAAVASELVCVSLE